MITKTVTIINDAGLHTRPAATMVKIAGKYQSEFFIQKDNYRINGKSIIGVMTLAAAKGSTLTIECDGSDEEELAHEVTAFFERGFDEL